MFIIIVDPDEVKRLYKKRAIFEFDDLKEDITSLQLVDLKGPAVN